MTKHFTISVADELIASAQSCAREEGTTVDDLINRLLTDYIERRQRVDAAMQAIAHLRVRIDTGGRKLTREEMNER